ncbi:MAG: ACP phosphodiesterase [Cyclobacteriaceae bacterium]|nr:ACP phosphodiesterase [Cyclobacteriaceae bacterium]
MNYLAHIYLSGSNEKLMIGNFMADGIKGKQWEKYELEIQKGVHLHRAIDFFTDTHDIVKSSKSKIWNKYRHYNAVVIDIFYDHFLAKYWANYHPMELGEFVQETYHTLQDNFNLLPEKTQYLLPFMIKNNWLYNYQFIDGIDKVMKGMARRASFNSGMENATEDLEIHYDEFSSDFKTFFPLLEQFVKSKTESLE